MNVLTGSGNVESSDELKKLAKKNEQLEKLLKVQQNKMDNLRSDLMAKVEAAIGNAVSEFTSVEGFERLKKRMKEQNQIQALK